MADHHVYIVGVTDYAEHYLKQIAEVLHCNTEEVIMKGIVSILNRELDTKDFVGMNYSDIVVFQIS